ncbi:MAG: AAA family ATPase [Thermoplasmata archaeon]
MFRILLGYPTESKELEILRAQDTARTASGPAVVTPEELDLLSRAANQVHIDRDVLRYLSNLVRSTRTDRRVLLGASRSAVLFLRAARATALLSGRTYVIPDDIKALAFPSLNHRLILRPEILAQQIAGDSGGVGDSSRLLIAGILESILSQLTVPR